MPQTHRLGRLVSPRVAITVTAEAIQNSVRRDSAHCMIADAIRHSQPGAHGISVDLQTVRWTNLRLGLRYVYLTPRTAQVALIDYDQGDYPKPFAFVLSGGHTIKSKSREPKKPAAAHPRKRAKSLPMETILEAISAYPDGATVADVRAYLEKKCKVTRTIDKVKRQMTSNKILNWVELRNNRWFLRQKEELPEVPRRRQIAPRRGSDNVNTITGLIGGRAPPKVSHARRRGFGLRNFGAY
jgi:hypothetical protein